jgi:PAS domain-containing protein
MMIETLQKKYSELAFMQAQYAISVTDLEGNVLAVNKAYIKLYCINHESDIIGKKQSMIKSSGVPKETYVEMWKTIKDGNGQWKVCEAGSFYRYMW